MLLPINVILNVVLSMYLSMAPVEKLEVSFNLVVDFHSIGEKTQVEKIVEITFRNKDTIDLFLIGVDELGKERMDKKIGKKIEKYLEKSYKVAYIDKINFEWVPENNTFEHEYRMTKFPLSYVELQPDEAVSVIVYCEQPHHKGKYDLLVTSEVTGRSNNNSGYFSKQSSIRGGDLKPFRIEKILIE